MRPATLAAAGGVTVTPAELQLHARASRQQQPQHRAARHTAQRRHAPDFAAGQACAPHIQADVDRKHKESPEWEMLGKDGCDGRMEEG